MAFRWPNVECCIVSFENYRGSGPVLLRNSTFLRFFRGGGPDHLSPSGSAHGTGQCIHLLRYTENPFYRAHRLLYDTLRTFYRMHKFLKRRVFFLISSFFFNSENSSTYFKVSCISLQKILIDEITL